MPFYTNTWEPICQLFFHCVPCEASGPAQSVSAAPCCRGPLDLSLTLRSAFREQAGLPTIMCFGTTIVSPPMSCRSSPTSCVTPTCAARAPCPSRPQHTTLTWWRSGPGTTWWTKNMTGEWQGSPGWRSLRGSFRKQALAAAFPEWGKWLGNHGWSRPTQAATCQHLRCHSVAVCVAASPTGLTRSSGCCPMLR